MDGKTASCSKQNCVYRNKGGALDKLQSIRFFLKLSETLSFKETASYFGVPPSTVSRAIKALEAELGVMLFERTTRQVRLTEAGGWYGAEVNAPVRALAAADGWVRVQSEEHVGTLRLTTMTGYGAMRLFPVLDKFRMRYPRIVCDVELTDRYLDLSSGEIDIAIRATSDPPEYMVARRLHSNRFVLVGSPGYLQKHGRPKTLADISQHPALAYRGVHGVIPWLARRDSGEIVTVERTPAFISNDGLQVLRSAQRGEGLALLPLWGVAEGLADGSLVQVHPEDGRMTIRTGPEMSVFVLYDPMKARLGKVRAMVDFLMQELLTK